MQHDICQIAFILISFSIGDQNSITGFKNYISQTFCFKRSKRHPDAFFADHIRNNFAGSLRDQLIFTNLQNVSFFSVQIRTCFFVRRCGFQILCYLHTGYHYIVQVWGKAIRGIYSYSVRIGNFRVIPFYRQSAVFIASGVLASDLACPCNNLSEGQCFIIRPCRYLVRILIEIKCVQCYSAHLASILHDLFPCRRIFQLTCGIITVELPHIIFTFQFDNRSILVRSIYDGHCAYSDFFYQSVLMHYDFIACRIQNLITSGIKQCAGIFRFKFDSYVADHRSIRKIIICILSIKVID